VKLERSSFAALAVPSGREAVVVRLERIAAGHRRPSPERAPRWRERSPLERPPRRA
jgi:hypothetical protein